MQIAVSLEDVWKVLETIEDPELPITVTDLGLIREVQLVGGGIRVRMIPTYSACPAIQVMRRDIQTRLLKIPGIETVDVELSYGEPWTVDMMSARGRQRLLEHGMSVPASRRAVEVICPFCGSTNTILENLFGPTLCRAIYYCRACRNPIERFKVPADD